MTCFCVAENIMTNKTFYPGNVVRLQCQPGSNLAQVQWSVNNHIIAKSNKYQIYNNNLFILKAADSDAGLYTCTSIESSNVIQRVTYNLRLENITDQYSDLPQVQEQQNTLLALKALVIILTLILAALVVWNFYKGHFPVPRCFGKAEERPQSVSGCQEPLQTGTKNTAGPMELNRNNNHNRLSGLPDTVNQHNGDKVF